MGTQDPSLFVKDLSFFSRTVLIIFGNNNKPDVGLEPPADAKAAFAAAHAVHTRQLNGLERPGCLAAAAASAGAWQWFCSKKPIFLIKASSIKD